MEAILFCLPPQQTGEFAGLFNSMAQQGGTTADDFALLAANL